VTIAYDFSATSIDGEPRSFADFRGDVLLIVNVASKCGFTPQYAGLEELHRRYREQGLTVLGFPCDQFGHQEPGTETEIAEFCSTTYDVTFPMFAKVEVNGDDAHPLYHWLTEQTGGPIEWNFTKFLIGRDGTVLGRFASNETPESLDPKVASALT
jgi:glutathione peroxidase